MGFDPISYSELTIKIDYRAQINIGLRFEHSPALIFARRFASAALE
jgi:hypothetical protein